MGRVSVLTSAVILFAASIVPVTEYVAGKTRADGLYLPPHYRGAAQAVHPAEAWFDALHRQDEGHEAVKSLPPASAGAPPVPPMPQAARH